jgi:3-dehydrosphinganine reductase
MTGAVQEEGRGAALVTGGSSGIGLAAARLLAARGFAVALVARREEQLALAAESIRRAVPGARIETASADVRDPEAMEAVVLRAARNLGRLDWLIASAGVVEPGDFLELPLSSHRVQMETNYFGLLNAVRPAVRVMMAQASGRLVLVSSGAGIIGLPGYTAYSPSKFAVRGLAEALRVELAPTGITVTVSFPPDTDTPQLEREAPLRPPANRAIAGAAGVLSPEVVASRFIEAAEKGRFLSTPGPAMTALGLLHSVIGPILRRRHEAVTRRFARRPKT